MYIINKKKSLNKWQRYWVEHGVQSLFFLMELSYSIRYILNIHTKTEYNNHERKCQL